MTKQEFLQALGEKLSEGLPANEVLRQMQYYEGYFDAETSRGRSEEEVLFELGDPVLLARNVLESPAARTAYWNTQTPYEQGFAEGSYERRNAASANTETARARSESSGNAGYSRTADTREGGMPDGVWRRAKEPEELRSRGSWQKMPDPEETGSYRGKAEGPARSGSTRPSLMPLILAAVLVTAVIVGIVTGNITKNALILPLILLAAAVLIVFILVMIRRKRK